MTFDIRGQRLLDYLWTECGKSIEPREACCKNETFQFRHGEKIFELVYCHIKKSALEQNPPYFILGLCSHDMKETNKVMTMALRVNGQASWIYLGTCNIDC